MIEDIINKVLSLHVAGILKKRYKRYLLVKLKAVDLACAAVIEYRKNSNSKDVKFIRFMDIKVDCKDMEIMVVVKINWYCTDNDNKDNTNNLLSSDFIMNNYASSAYWTKN